MLSNSTHCAEYSASVKTACKNLDDMHEFPQRYSNSAQDAYEMVSQRVDAYMLLIVIEHAESHHTAVRVLNSLAF